MIDAQLNNFNQAILTALDTYAGQTCLKIKQRGHFRDISYAKLRTLTFRMVKFLQHQGITDGERVAIAANNCPEWMVLCFATLLSGGVVVPLRPSLAPNVLHRTLQDSGARLVLLDNETFIRTTAAKAKGNRGTLPQLKTILSLTKTAESGGKVVPAAAVLSEAVSLTAQELRAIQTNAEKVAPDSVAVIHYTSDRSGELRGAVFDHARLLEIVQHVAAWFGLDEDDLGFSLLTWSYSSSLRTTLHHFLSGVTTVLGEVGTAAEDMQQTSPTVTLNMPYFFERFYEGVMEETLVNMPEASQDVFRWALAKGREFMAAGSSATEELRQAYTRADMTFFSQIRGQIGGRMHRFYSTGAPLSQEIAEFFEAIGLPALNVYNLTEAGGFPTISSLHDRRSGSCGRTAPGFEIRIADDGEVLVRSNMIMREYWQRPEDTRQLVDSAGWLHTGDLGYLDEDGYLYLTGRKQPVEVLSTGRKITPAVIEEALMQSPLIFQAVVFAEGRPYVSAFIVPDLEAFGAHFQGDEADGDEPTADTEPSASLNWFWPRESDDFDPMITAAHPRIKVLLDKVIGEINRYRDRWEHIKTFSLLDQAHSQVANELGQLKTTDRQAILQRYAGLVESMYPSAPRVGDTAVTRVEVSPERMRDLLEKESILDAWIADAGIEFLLRLANEKHIDASSMVHVCDVAASIAQMENEERPLSTAIIVGDPARISRILPPSQIQLLRHDHIRRMRSILVTLAKMVDGVVLGYIIDRHGYVRGVHNINVPLDDQYTNFLLGPQFRRHAAISQACDAMVFYVPAGGRQVRVFAGGQLVGRYSNGDWSPDRMYHVDTVITQLVEEKNFQLRLLQRVLRCAFQMSEQNLGAIFVLGDADAVMRSSDASEISHFALVFSKDIEQMSDLELINFAKQDGATVIDTQGYFRGCMVLLRPAADTPAEIGPGKGARHSSAAKMSAEAHCLAITVSQDGPITIYDSGQRILSL